jgi:hypothetical protein
MARAAMGASMDDLRHAMRRWLAVVRTGDCDSYFRWSATLRGDWIGNIVSGDWHADIYVGETREPQKTTVPARAALLVDSFAAGPIFISIGTFHHCVFDRDDSWIFLSAVSGLFAGVRGEHRNQPRDSGNAFSERRDRGIVNWRAAGIWLLPIICMKISYRDLRAIIRKSYARFQRAPRRTSPRNPNPPIRLPRARRLRLLRS